MESMRDVNRVMEREIKKGSSPLKLDHIEFGDYSYQEIMSQEKLFEVLTYLLRIGDFKQYAGKTILNNVYMDLRWKKPVFKRTKTIMERNNIFATIRRYVKKLKPQYNGDVYLETVRCYFDISIWKSADIHIKGMKHTPSLCRTSILGHCIRIVWWQEKNMLLTV